MKSWYIGTIGFSYKDWVGEFYPAGSTHREYLNYYCKVFNAVEIDSTFHSIPKQSIVQSWSSIAPQDFKFSVKTPRVITHDLGLNASEGIMDEFIDAINSLGEKTGPILIQLPPSFSQENYPLVEEFLANLPTSHRYAVELRHPSWYNEKTKGLLSQYQVCWVAVDYPHVPAKIYPTTDFLYIRWIGVNNMYHIHTHERIDKTVQLKAWIKEIYSHLGDVFAVYGFFNNDYAGFAAGTGKRFLHLAGLDAEETGAPYQERLF